MDELPQLMKSLNLEIEATQEFTPFRHTFSHFHLDIQPLVIDCQPLLAQEINENSQQQWYDLHAQASVGFAASTKKLITLLEP